MDRQIHHDWIFVGFEDSRLAFQSHLNALSDTSNGTNKVVWLKDAKGKSAKCVLDDLLVLVLDAPWKFGNCVADKVAGKVR